MATPELNTFSFQDYILKCDRKKFLVQNPENEEKFQVTLFLMKKYFLISFFNMLNDPAS